MAKKISLLIPTKRFELWWAYSSVFSVAVLLPFWFVDDWSQRPLVQLLTAAALVVGYALIAWIVGKVYDKDGNRA